MKLHFLGTSGYHPTRQRDTACLMIPELGVILDAGSGIFRARELIETKELHIFLTHVHLDHVVGLTFLIDVLHEQSVDHVWVYCDPEKQAVIEHHLYHPLLFPVPPRFVFRELTSSPISLPGDGRLTAFPITHPGGCLGFRLQWPDHDMAYVTDTTAALSSDYVKQIRDVDLLVHECYFPDGYEEQAALTGHSCLTPVAQVAAAAKAKRLALVHLNPLDEDGSQMNLKSVDEIFSPILVPGDDEIIEF